MLKITAFILAVTALTFNRASAQTTSLGGVELTLGMPKTDAMAKLAKGLKVNELSDDNWYVLQVDPLGSGATDLGVVAFEGGKLVYISRKWESKSDANSVEFARGLLGVLADMVNRGDDLCAVQINQNEQPTGTLKEAHLVCASRSVHISTLIVQGTETAIVEEVLRLPERKSPPVGASGKKQRR